MGKQNRPWEHSWLETRLLCIYSFRGLNSRLDYPHWESRFRPIARGMFWFQSHLSLVSMFACMRRPAWFYTGLGQEAYNLHWKPTCWAWIGGGLTIEIKDFGIFLREVWVSYKNCFLRSKYRLYTWPRSMAQHWKLFLGVDWVVWISQRPDFVVLIGVRSIAGRFCSKIDERSFLVGSFGLLIKVCNEIKLLLAWILSVWHRKLAVGTGNSERASLLNGLPQQ